MMNLNEIKKQFREAPINYLERDTEALRSALAEMKQDAVSSNNEDFANALWAYEQILAIQTGYISAFDLMKAEKYYDGWCCLARVEMSVFHLRPHYRSAYKGFHTQFIAEHTARFQALFPYRLFMSIEAINQKKTCSICGAEVKLRSSCRHKPGQIYGGEICARNVHKMDLPAVSLVTSPADKCCVAFLGSGGKEGIQDTYDYSLVSYPVSKLRSPFDRWNFVQTRRQQPYSCYADIAKDSACPCASGKTYADCCLLESGVWRPHFEFTFEFVEHGQKSELLFMRGGNSIQIIDELVKSDGNGP